MKNNNLIKNCILGLAFGFMFAVGADEVRAEDSPSSLYVPLIGITSVPSPLALPKGPGDVTYSYAVKNFLQEVALTNIQVVDNKCGDVKFVTGDDNHDSKLDYSETWRYRCTTRLLETTQSTSVATGFSNDIAARHNAYATVIVGSSSPAPIVSIVNITKVAYPLSLPVEGGKITFTYRVNNPGVIPLSGVTVSDNKCKSMSGKLGDTNGNQLLDISEVWIYTCTMTLKQTTTNTVTVSAFANGLKATDNATITVKVDNPNFPNVGTDPDSEINPNFKIIVWGIMSAILLMLVKKLLLTRKRKITKSVRKRR